MKRIELTEDQIEQFKQALEKSIAWWEQIKKAARTAYGIVFRLPGYKRAAKIKQLMYYQSISLGKSNNWRRMHGLAPLRKRTEPRTC